MQALYGLNLDDELSVDDQIDPQGSRDQFASVAQRHATLLFDLETRGSQLDGQTVPIDGFEKPRPKSPVHGYPASDDLLT